MLANADRIVSDHYLTSPEYLSSQFLKELSGVSNYQHTTMYTFTFIDVVAHSPSIETM